MPEQVRSAECPSERSERLERLVRCATERVAMGDEMASARIKWQPHQDRTLPFIAFPRTDSHSLIHWRTANTAPRTTHLNTAPISFRYRAACFDED